MEINHLDLFSGIGGFHLGFEKAGYKVNAFFSEIDKHAIAVYQNQFKDATYVGSVTDVRAGDLPRIDLITFGSPCQDFSLAGKRKGMSGDRSSLISEAIRLIDECRPRVFVWENVKGAFSSNSGEDFAGIIQAFADLGGYRLEWQLLNTAWFLAQNRERIYLVGYLGRPRHYSGSVFPINETSGKDIPMEGAREAVSKTLTARGQADLHSGLQLVEVQYTSATEKYAGPHEVVQINQMNESNNGTQPYMQNRVYDSNGIAPSLTLFTNQMKVKLDDNYTYQAANDIVRDHEFTEGEVKGLDTGANQGVVQPVQIGQSTKTFAYKSGTLVGKEGQDAFTIRSSNPNGVKDQSYRIRRLTPIECERLQGFPDDHTAFGNYDGEVKPMANTHRYKQCGNAVTVDVVEAVAKRIKLNELL